MNKSKKLFRISLQHFGEALSASPEAGLASSHSAADSSLSDTDNGISVEQEFESLIKGGRFENAFKKRTQAIIDKRFKNYKALEDSQAKQQPVIDRLASIYGVDPLDTQAILEKLQTDSRLAPGIPPTDTGDSTPVSAKEDAKDNSADIKAPSFKEQFISDKAKALSKQWTMEAKQLKPLFPSFDLGAELKNPAFTSLIKSGMPLRRAYTAVHSDELIKKAVTGTAMRVKEQTLKDIRANGSRAAENGLSAKGAITHKTDVASLSGKEIRSILQQVERGTKVRF